MASCRRIFFGSGGLPAPNSVLFIFSSPPLEELNIAGRNNVSTEGRKEAFNGTHSRSGRSFAPPGSTDPSLRRPWRRRVARGSGRTGQQKVARVKPQRDEEGARTTLGQRIRNARKTRGLTQGQLGAPGVTASYISMLEHDRVRPSLATLGVLAERLNTPLASLLDAPPLPAEQARVVAQRGESLLRQHRFAEAYEVFTAGVPAAGESGDLRLQIRVALGVGQALAGLRQFDLAERYLNQGWSMAQSVADVELTAAAANALGFLAFRARRFAHAREIFQSALDELDARGAPHGELRGKLLANLGRVYVELGLPVQAMEFLRESESALRGAADPVQRALLLFNLGVAAERQQAFAESHAYFDQAEALLKVHENVRLLGTVKRSLGMLHLAEGRLADAERELMESRRLAEQSHDDEGAAQTLVE
ncbi:MAG: helix-turn-helix domain-containing protein, partial [bacterium]